MFHVNIKAMENIAEDMKSQIRRINQEIDAVKSVKHSLEQLSDMDGISQELDRILTRMEQERGKFFFLLTGLQQSVCYYMSCEDIILDFAGYSK